SEGCVTVAVELEQTIGDDLMLKFHVTDTGIGMEEKNLAQIFKSFTQVHSTKVKDYGGTGLGLSICQRLVQVMGGKIWATSELGRGSEFYFTLKVKTYHDPSVTLHEEPPKTLDLSGHKILLVEDKVANQELVKDILRGTNCEVKLAENGYEALIYLENEEFDLVLMDLHMPMMDGIETTEQIRKIDSVVLNKTIPIIALTGKALENEKEECLALGINDFISKPIDPKLFLETINLYCDGNRT
ncbi:MAG: response regulator, partial [SAR324 cluster bacterium]|nr:response regulator [SAR324 cluster bacterium]